MIHSASKTTLSIFWVESIFFTHPIPTFYLQCFNTENKYHSHHLTSVFHMGWYNQFHVKWLLVLGICCLQLWSAGGKLVSHSMLPSGQQGCVKLTLYKENKNAKTHFPTKLQMHLSFCFCKSKNLRMVEIQRDHWNGFPSWSQESVGKQQLWKEKQGRFQSVLCEGLKGFEYSQFWSSWNSLGALEWAAECCWGEETHKAKQFNEYVYFLQRYIWQLSRF